MININHILEGWGNSIKDKFDMLNDPELKLKSERRLMTCDSCPLRDNNTCSRKRQDVVVMNFYYNHLKQYRKKGDITNGCGCNLSAKSLCNDCQCPRGMWEEIK